MRCHRAGISPGRWWARATASEAPSPAAPAAAAAATARLPAGRQRVHRRPADDPGDGRDPVAPGRGHGRTSRITSKWDALAPTTNVCQISW